MLDTEAKLFKKTKATSGVRPLPMSAQQFNGAFSLRKKKMPRVVLILICGEIWCKSSQIRSNCADSIYSCMHGNFAFFYSLPILKIV